MRLIRQVWALASAGSFTSQVAFLHRAFVPSHASDERQERRLLRWLQETSSPRCTGAHPLQGCLGAVTSRLALVGCPSCLLRQGGEPAGRGDFHCLP